MYITIDIGGTNLRINSFKNLTPDGFIEKRNFPSSEFQKYGFAIKKIKEETNQILKGEKLEGLAISMSGEVNPVKGVVVDSDAFSSWNGFELIKDLSKELECENIKIENDAVVAGLAERYFGLGKDQKSMGFVIVGTGVGAVRMQQFENKDLIYPTEFGHTIVVPDGERCICGQRGCLEVYTSGKGLQSFYGSDAREIEDEETWLLASRFLAQGIMNFLIFHPVEIFVFSGGLASNHPMFIEKLQKNVERMIMKKFNHTIPEFKISKFGEDAGSFGGLALLDKDNELINTLYL